MITPRNVDGRPRPSHEGCFAVAAAVAVASSLSLSVLVHATRCVALRDNGGSVQFGLAEFSSQRAEDKREAMAASQAELCSCNLVIASDTVQVIEDSAANQLNRAVLIVV